jgi:predicted ArsR family transcriptional regulator
MTNQKSLEAYIMLEPSLNELQATVREAIKHIQPCTDNEIIEFLGINPSTVRPRRIELMRLGVIEVEGEKTQKNGRKATTWRIKKW